ncbi:MAG: hypothetical protein Q8J69_08970 [Sphingobacteriaceae bacterium]|nr:hypothetical protein [Sphingobacteriaceae bacterium]
MEKDQKTRYLRAQKSSFKTRLDLYVFEVALHGKNQLLLSEFLEFKITDELVHLYSAAYWQKSQEETIGHSNITVKALYENMQALKKAHEVEFSQWQKAYADRYASIFPHAQFEALLKQVHCEYCNITEAVIAQLGEQGKLFKKSERGWSLEIDRKNSNFEYAPENCVMACYWCNNAKTDEFTFEEFAKVGAAIKAIWESRRTKNP